MKIRRTALTALLLAAALVLPGCSGGGAETPTGGQDTAGTPDTAETVTDTQPEGESQTMTEAETQAAGTEAESETAAETVTEPETDPEQLELKNPDIGQRYFIYRIWNFRKCSLSEFKYTVDAAEAAGFNAIKIHMPWYLFERKAGSFDWSGFDEMFDYVINEKGMKALCSVDLTREYVDRFFPDEAYMKDYGGKLSVGGAGADRAQISFCCDYAVEAAVNAYAEAVAHFDGLFGAGILLYLPCFNQYAETEYWAAGEYDYSDIAVDSFRSWVKFRFDSIDDFNAVCGTDYRFYSEVIPPAVSASDALGILWYQFRHEKLKNAIDRLADAQKAVCPDTKMAVQIGSVWDGAAKARGTLGFAELCEKVDVLWVDDGPTMNHQWSMDYIRSVLPASVELAQEIDSPAQVGASTENYLKQGMECFERGATYVSIANWSIDQNFETYKPVWREIADTWLGEDHPAVLPMTADTPVLEVSLYDLFRHGSANYLFGKHSRLAKDSGFVYISLTDDLTARQVAPSAASASFPASFSSEQGKGGFSYMSYTRKTFTPMTWDASNNRWQGDEPFTLVMAGSMHPDASDAALVYTCPQDGTLTYAFTAAISSDQSTGVQVCVMQNGEKVWPESGKYQKVFFTEPLDTSVTLTVKKGDEIAFLLNPAGANSFDATAVTVDILYN